MWRDMHLSLFTAERLLNREPATRAIRKPSSSGSLVSSPRWLHQLGLHASEEPQRWARSFPPCCVESRFLGVSGGYAPTLPSSPELLPWLMWPSLETAPLLYVCRAPLWASVPFLGLHSHKQTHTHTQTHTPKVLGLLSMCQILMSDLFIY